MVEYGYHVHSIFVQAFFWKWNYTSHK